MSNNRAFSFSTCQQVKARPNPLTWTLIVPCVVWVAVGRAEERGVVDLFNGEDLSGWVNVNGSSDTWQVRDSMIVCTGEPRCFLRTRTMYENYVLQWECLHPNAGGNSGLFAHAAALPQVGAPYPEAIEAQLLDGDHGSLFGIRGASLIPVTNPGIKGRTALAGPLQSRCKPAGQWNHYVVTSHDGQIKLSVNGEVVSHAWRCSQVKGYIALQAEHTEVHFRNIRITPRSSSNPPADKIAQQDEGFVSLFDGVSFDGWKHLPGHEGHWVPSDGNIIYDGQAENKKRTEKDLWTTDEFGNFELIVDWRLSAKPHLKNHPIVLPNGDFDLDEKGQRKTFLHLDAGDSGIYLRGSAKAQVNIWSQELGSGEINAYRTDKTLPLNLRQSYIPAKNADLAFGQWNRFRVTMRENRVAVAVNGETVIRETELPGVPRTGPIGLQHHGAPIEFRNLFIKRIE